MIGLTLIAGLLLLQNPGIQGACTFDGDNSRVNCIHGLWNEDTCECDCIIPFCRDIRGYVAFVDVGGLIDK